MEIWSHIEFLNRPEPSEKDLAQKMNNLLIIAENGNPSHIFYLINLLTDKNKEIRNGACKTIITLFHKIQNKNGYYNSVKYCDIQKEDLEFFASDFSLNQYTSLLAIASLNSNGRLREYAVEKLSEIAHPEAIPFIIYRLADWVPQVREAAKKGIEKYTSIEYLDSLIENLPLFKWLQKVERVNMRDVYDGVIEFIATDNRSLVLEKFHHYPEKSRMLLAEHISNSLIELEKELETLLNDKQFRIRSLVANRVDKLNEETVERLLSDKSAKVRLQTLYALKERNDIQKIVINHLADESSSIRYFARFTLKGSDIDFASSYHQNLEKGKQIIGSINGLAELEARPFSGTVKKFLENPIVKIRVTAFLALRKLDNESVTEFALENLEIASGKLRNAIIEHLSFISRIDVLEKARNNYQSGDYELKRSMLLLFSKMGGWSVICDLMLGTIDADERLRNISQQYVEIWRKKATHLFTTPKKEDLERARNIFKQSHEVHEKNQYFKKNPLTGIDFFIS